jgi:serine/tyrosine/threonine adenylyltransferase
MQSNSKGFNLNNSYTKLPPKTYTFVKPTFVTQPEIGLFNFDLAEQLGLQFTPTDTQEIAQIFSGNVIPQGAEPLAQAYAGHQFGHFNMLGDGRAILLGEQITPNNVRFDIQLKGSGETPYSRRGDGRATFRSMLREYLISEAMHGLQIKTTRSLAVIGSGEKVYREEIQDGAILTRIASSHIRVGTFEYAKNYLSTQELEALLNYTVERHYPSIAKSRNKALEFFKIVMQQQIALVVQWMRVGFIHGVMNTDNMSIAGETIDYGPCAFMNAYNPKTVFSAIDTSGRYAFGNQPKIIYWNLSCLAEALLPLIHADIDTAVKLAEAELANFSTQFNQQWMNMMGEKIGCTNAHNNPAIQQLIRDLLDWMETNKADYTNTFLVIQNQLPATDIYLDGSFKIWCNTWQNLVTTNQSLQQAVAIMQKNNPIFIPRNHLVEQALDACSYAKDYTLFNELLAVVSNPYTLNEAFNYYTEPPLSGDAHYKTFCGT